MNCTEPDRRRPTDAPWWQGQWKPSPRYAEVERTAAYIAARDGTKIATYRYLPKDIGADRLPTVLIITPYVSEIQLTALGRLLAPEGSDIRLAKTLARHGIAVILVDIRGAGASFGVKRSFLKSTVMSDASDVVDWAITQPWSNGNVGATGVSAVGLTANWLAIARHPAVKAIAPRFTIFDIFYDVHPGGLLMNRFVDDVDRRVRLLDSNRLAEIPETKPGRMMARLLTKSIYPVDDDPDSVMLAAAIAEHSANESFATDIGLVEYRDDKTSGEGDFTLDDQSPFAHLHDIEASGAALYLFAGWLDGPFSRAQINYFQNAAIGSKKLVIGPWNHGGRQYSSPRAPAAGKSDFDQPLELARFFRHHLTGEDTGIASEPPIHFFTMGREEWQTSTQWPPANTQALSLFFGPERRLVTARPDEEGLDRHGVDMDASTGVHSRYGKHLTGPAKRASYPDRRRRDRTLLTYDSAPLPRDMEITGHPILSLFVSTDCAEGAFIAYLEDVAPDGRVSNITDGVLDGAFRKVSTEPAPYRAPGPHRTLRRADAEPMRPGEVMELTIDLFPISYWIPKGHCIRVALAGADCGNFPVIPKGRSPQWDVHRGGAARASMIELPVVVGADGQASGEATVVLE